MPASLLTLLDDITSLLDDVATMTKVAGRQTAGVIGDDLALNADQVTGMRPDRELPVVWAVAKGALLNKAILVPVALALSAFMPRAVPPLLFVGGLFLCYEGFHKTWEKLAGPPADADDTRAARAVAVADPAADLVAFERERVRGAIRTDFILSAEIIIIALGSMATAPLVQQVLSLAAIAVGMTVIVYLPVAGIVRMDDVGVRLAATAGEDAAAAGRRRTGQLLLATAPRLLRVLSIAGTVAMFLVGGGIVAHAIAPVEHGIAAAAAAARGVAPLLGTLVKTVLEGGAGVVAGAVASAVVGVVQRLRGGSARAPVAGA